MANNIDVKDAAASTQTLKTTDTAGVHTPHHNVDSSALPTGAATSAKQDTEITSLQLIDDIVLAEDAAASNGDKGVMALAVRKDTPGAGIGADGDYTPLSTDSNGRLLTNGSGATQPVSGTVTANIGTSGSLALDTTVGTTNTEIGGLTESAPGTDTASSGLNGRLQRIAQRLSTLIGLLPTALGANGGLKIEGVASGTVVPISVASVPSHAVTNAGTFAVQNTQDTGRVYDGAGNALVTKRAFVNQAASGSHATVITAVTSKKLRVLALAMVAGATATDITFESNSTAISPLFANAANGGAVLPFNPGGWLETASGEALKCTTGSGSTTGILVTYIEVA